MLTVKIKARDIERWAGDLDARSRLPVLLRRLVHATGRNLAQVDFPGHDNAERHGVDGTVDSATATAWVPAGRSVWELGTNADPKAKADADYDASLTKVDAETRATATFVFVTPRAWPGKTRWAQARRAAGEWRDVRALDASDLEQWLEQAPSVAVWLAEQLGHPTTGLESLDHAWTRWADATDPPLPPALFEPSIASAKRKLLDRLAAAPGRPIRLDADSRDEALAFLACLMREPELQAWAERAVIVTTPDALRWLAARQADLLPIVTSADAARELPTLGNRHVILWRGPGASHEPADLAPEPLGREAFDRALATIGITGDRADRLARGSACSPTILRRRLARDPAIAAPPWAADHGARRRLVPIALVGAWRVDHGADRAILAQVAGRDADAVESDLTALLALDDSPVWSTADHRGVISPLDSLLAVMPAITCDDLKRLLEAAETVLGEPDPALDLPADKRWMAGLHGKERRHSDTLRVAIAETLVLLVVHGREGLHARTGFDVAAEVQRLVHDLLTPPTPDRLRSLDREMPRLAEAAPDTFLQFVEHDLQAAGPVIFALLTRVDSTLPFASPDRTGLLWALELLAWNRSHLSRVCLVLGRLAEVEIADNWTNKPINSLQAIFRCCMPQTAASLQDRIAALKLLAQHHPWIAWQIAAAQLAGGPQVGSYSLRPRWRDDASGAGRGVTHGERREFQRAALDLMLAWPSHDATTLGDLVARLDLLPEADREAVWERIDTWAPAASDDAKAALRDRIRAWALTRRSPVQLRLAELDRLLDRPSPDERTLQELVAKHDRAPVTDQQRVRALIEASAAPAADDGSARLRDRLPAAARVWLARAREALTSILRRAREAHEALAPTDPVIRHHWLFAVPWVDPLADDVAGDVTDVEARQDAVERLRHDALGEIWRERGFAGVEALLVSGDTAGPIGRTLGRIVTETDQRATLARSLLASSGAPPDKAEAALRGLLAGLAEPERDDLLERVSATLDSDDLVRLLACAPFRAPTWRRPDLQDPAIRERYWRSALPDWGPFTPDERARLIDSLLDAGRPAAAFAAVHLDLDAIDTDRLRRLLQALATTDEQPPAPSVAAYDLAEAVRVLATRPDARADDLGSLEWAFFDAVVESEHGIPNLERRISENPADFVHLLTLVYRRSDDIADPPGLVPPDPVDRKTAAERAFSVLDRVRRIPGTRPDGTVDATALVAWIGEVRRLCVARARFEIADEAIGQLLAHAPADPDGTWPCAAVREALEAVRTDAIARGLRIGVCNARGEVGRGQGGDQERALAGRYRAWADKVRFEHPFTATILDRLVDAYAREALGWDHAALIDRRQGR